ncbi:LysR family transcriptional regulator [Thalassiella azotivora]
MTGQLLSIAHLVSFLTVVELGTVTAAARHLNYSQPTVTAHVQGLEKALGAPLFHRGVRGLSLTSAGRALTQPGAALLADARALHRIVAVHSVPSTRRSVDPLETGLAHQEP